MAKLGTLNLKGASGQSYAFDVYPADTTWREGVACVYYISKRDASGNHTKIYVGETSDLRARLNSHHQQDCFERNGYNAVSIHQVANANSRLAIETDLVRALDPPCNR